MRVPDVRTPFRETPRKLVMAVALSLRTVPPPDADGVQATHKDRETCIMSGMDGSHGMRIPVPELIEIDVSRVSATLEGAGA